jgi:hypothetical protein
MLAAIRPDDVNLPLLVHVLGALLLVGTLMTAVAFQYAGWKRDDADAALSAARLTFRTLLFGALPAWFVMRIGAQWVYSEAGWDDIPESVEEPAWLGIGWITADAGGLLILIAIVLAGLNVRRVRASGGASGRLGRAATAVATLALIAYLVAVWAMSGKPG